jgi:polysaccharide export outer membrane protein
MRPLLLLSLAAACLAQAPPSTPLPPDAGAPSSYALGVDDQLMVRALDAEEVTTTVPIRIDARGNITLPMIGRVHAAGLTTEQLADLLEDHLKHFLQHPDVSVYLVETRSQPVSVLGAVQTPGVHQLEGHKTLFEVISLAGGVRQDAGYSIKITRRMEWGRIPLPDAKDDPTGRYSIASVNIKSVMDAQNPAENIEIKPEDVITVPKGQLVYVIGTVHKPGGFVLGEDQHLSALQILSLAEGLDRFADARKARIMRPVPGSDTRTEIPIDLKALLAGKVPDVPLQANDLLFVPLSGRKSGAATALTSVLGVTSAVAAAAVYHY